MKKIIVIFICVYIIVFMSNAFAEIDYTALTDKELTQIIISAQNELKRREKEDETKIYLINQDGISLYLTGEYSVYGGGYSDSYWLKMDAVLINNSKNDILVADENCSVNSWKAGCVISQNSVLAGEKTNTTVEIVISDAGIKTLSEVENVKIQLVVWDSHSPKKLVVTKSQTLSFR